MTVVHRITVIHNAVAVYVRTTCRVYIGDVIDTVGVAVVAVIRRAITIDINVGAVRNAIAISVGVAVVRIESIRQPVVVAVQCVVDRISVVINAIAVAIIAAGCVYVGQVIDAIAISVSAIVWSAVPVNIHIGSIRNAVAIGVRVIAVRIQVIRQAVVVTVLGVVNRIDAVGYTVAVTIGAALSVDI